MQIKTPYAFTLDIVKPTKIPIMEFYKTDVNTSQMLISITNNDEVVDLTGHTTILNIKKADGTEIQNLATVSDAVNGLINVSLTTQSLTAIGECRVQLTVFEGTNRKSTHEFKYYVKSSLLNAEVPLSSNEYGLLLQLIDDVQEVENILNTSEAERVEAENTREVNENNREILKGQLDTLKTNLESLQSTLNTLNTNITNSETTRNTNEEARQTLKGQLDTLKTSLEDLQTSLNNSETTRENNETTRISQEADRQALKSQLESLQSTLQALENTLNTNDTTRTNTFNTKVTEVNNKITEATNSITDIENRFALLTTSQQQASEVINARTSTIRNRTFADLDSRLEETEKDILTSQSTSVVDSVVPVNHLTNSLDGATDIAIKGQSLVQLIKNGNFASGTSGWDKVIGATLTSSNNTLFSTGTGGSGSPAFGQTTPLSFKLNNKIFVKAKVRVTNSNCINIVTILKNSVGGDISNSNTLITSPVINQWYTVYAILTETIDTGIAGVVPHFRHAYADGTTANGKVMEVQEVMAFDLTSLGLESKSADEINAMLPSYFEGIGSVEGGTSVIKSVGENLFDGWELGVINVNTGVTTSSINNIRSKNFIQVKANTVYSAIDTEQISANARNMQYVIEYDSNKNYIKYTTLTMTPIVFTTTSTTKFIKFVSQAVGTLSFVIGDYTNYKTMLNQGATPKPYQQYKESKVQLSDYIESQYFPLRSIGTLYDEYTPQGNKLYKRICEKTNPTVYIVSSLTSTYKISVITPNSKFYYAAGNVYKGVSLIKYEANASADYEHYYFSNSSNHAFVFVNKTTIDSLQGATLTDKAQKYMEDVVCIYELATPTEITLDRKIDLPIYRNGTIIQEPTKLYPKLSYSFPLNTGKSIESIVSNLAIVKDNQQFIMSYLLDLDTRLTLGGH